MKVFIVEDDKWYADLLSYHLSLNPDYEITHFSTGKKFLENLYKNPDVVTLDYSLPDYVGKELLVKVKEYNADIPVVIVSGQDDISTAVSLMKEGAYDYIIKDDDAKNRLWVTLNNLKERFYLKEEVVKLKQEVVQKYDFQKSIKGTSKPMKSVFSLMEKATKTNINVSVSGATGTGKEVVAKAIHYNSGRRDKPFIAVNVSAIPNELIESELFGFEKGAFTGANSRKKGKFEEANKGTLFLDEIGDMDLNMQAKLLRALQEKEISRLGGNEIIKVDIRLIVATHKNLGEEVKNGRFREDLYYRLLGLPILLPDLKDRGEDVIILAKFFTDEFCKENNMPKVKFSEKAVKKLMQYSFPGNVRELKASVELACVMCNGSFIDDSDINFQSVNQVQDLLASEKTLREYNFMIINHYLNKYDKNVIEVAKKLDVGKSTIYRMLKEMEEIPILSDQ